MFYTALYVEAIVICSLQCPSNRTRSFLLSSPCTLVYNSKTWNIAYQLAATCYQSNVKERHQRKKPLETSANFTKSGSKGTKKEAVTRKWHVYTYRYTYTHTGMFIHTCSIHKYSTSSKSKKKIGFCTWCATLKHEHRLSHWQTNKLKTSVLAESHDRKEKKPVATYIFFCAETWQHTQKVNTIIIGSTNMCTSTYNLQWPWLRQWQHAQENRKIARKIEGNTLDIWSM